MWVDGQAVHDQDGHNPGKQLHPGIFIVIVLVVVTVIVGVVIGVICYKKRSKKNKGYRRSYRERITEKNGANVSDMDANRGGKVIIGKTPQTMMVHELQKTSATKEEPTLASPPPTYSSSIARPQTCPAGQGSGAQCGQLSGDVSTNPDWLSSTPRPPSSQSVRSAWSKENAFPIPAAAVHLYEREDDTRYPGSGGSQENLAEIPVIDTAPR